MNGDFEAAVVSAIIKSFQIPYYWLGFNFNQCLWRQLKNIGLTVEYKENEHPTRIQNMRYFGIITFQ